MSRRTLKRRWLLAISASGLLIVVLAVLAIIGTWPFESTPANSESERHVVWSGKVALLENDLYALDELPVKALSNCARCVQITNEVLGHATISAGNGIQGWPGNGEPSFVDCVLLRNRGTLNSIDLGATITSLAAVSRGGWICATGNNDGLMRMHYEGQEGGRYLFSVTAWGLPPEG